MPRHKPKPKGHRAKKPRRRAPEVIPMTARRRDRFMRAERERLGLGH